MLPNTSQTCSTVVDNYISVISNSRCFITSEISAEARLWEDSCEGVWLSATTQQWITWAKVASGGPRTSERAASVCSKRIPVNTLSDLIKLQHHHDIAYFKRCASGQHGAEGAGVHAEVNTHFLNASEREPDVKRFEAVWNALVVLLLSLYNARWKHMDEHQESAWMLISLPQM